MKIIKQRYAPVPDGSIRIIIGGDSNAAYQTTGRLEFELVKSIVDYRISLSIYKHITKECIIHKDPLG